MKHTLLAAAALVGFTAMPALACTQMEAQEMLGEIYQNPAYIEMVGNASSKEDADKVVAFNETVAEGGRFYASGEYEKACEAYSEAQARLGMTAEAVSESDAPVE